LVLGGRVVATVAYGWLWSAKHGRQRRTVGIAPATAEQGWIKLDVVKTMQTFGFGSLKSHQPTSSNSPPLAPHPPLHTCFVCSFVFLCFVLLVSALCEVFLVPRKVPYKI